MNFAKQKLEELCEGSVTKVFLLATNRLMNSNIVPRLLDDLLTPMYRLLMSKEEIVTLTALILLDAGAKFYPF